MTTEQTTTPAPALSDINPLITYEEWDADTAANVRGALGFIADALAGMGDGKISDETAYGASRLILCCVAAMEVTSK